MLIRARHQGSLRGQSMVEFALILPLLVLVTLGIFDAGRAVFAYHTVANSARAAARVAIVNQDPVAIRTAAKTEAVGLGLVDADITLAACSTFDCEYSVSVSYDYESVTPLIGNLFHPTISSTASMRVEFPNP